MSSSSSENVLHLIRDREFAYLLLGTRLRAKQKIAKTDIGSIHFEAMDQGDVIDLPRWVAEVLVDLGLCESEEESFSSEVFKAVTREKIAGNDQLSTLKPDFYLKIRRHMAYANDSDKLKPSEIPELEKTRTLIYDLMALRLRKILSIASSLSPPADIREKLAPEEYLVFDSVYSLLRSWRSSIMEAK